MTLLHKCRLQLVASAKIIQKEANVYFIPINLLIIQSQVCIKMDMLFVW